VVNNLIDSLYSFKVQGLKKENNFDMNDDADASTVNRAVAVALTSTATSTSTERLRRQLELANKRAPANEAAFDDCRARLKHQHTDNTVNHPQHHPTKNKPKKPQIFYQNGQLLFQGFR